MWPSGSGEGVGDRLSDEVFEGDEMFDDLGNGPARRRFVKVALRLGEVFDSL